MFGKHTSEFCMAPALPKHTLLATPESTSSPTGPGGMEVSEANEFPDLGIAGFLQLVDTSISTVSGLWLTEAKEMYSQQHYQY